MCGRFEALTREQVEEVIAEVEGKAAARATCWPNQPQHVRPSDQASVIVQNKGLLAAKELKWGFDSPQGSGLVFNSRIERVLAGEGMWSSVAQTGRCVVPAVAYYEPHRIQTLISAKTGRPVKASYRFVAQDGEPYLLMAGLAAQGRFSVVTTEPDSTVSPIHDRMPLLLTRQAALEWMRGDWQRILQHGCVPVYAEQEPTDNHEQTSLF